MSGGPTFEVEVTWWAGQHVVVGLDEVGRGSLAGPIVVGAVVWTEDDAVPPGIRDSKKITDTRRRELAPAIWTAARAAAVGSASAEEIDQWGIRTAQAVATHRALDALSVTPTAMIIDGPTNFAQPPRQMSLAAAMAPLGTWGALPCTCIVTGDDASLSVAAAAIIAKVWRDDYMHDLELTLPGYGFAEHVGYGTASHRAAISSLGATREHRQTWHLID